MDLKEKVVNKAKKFLGTRDESYLQTYAMGDIERGSEDLTASYVSMNRTKRFINMGLTVIPDIYLIGGAIEANRVGSAGAEALCYAGLVASFLYVLNEAQILIGNRFFTDDIRNEVREALIPHQRPMYSRPGVTPEM